MKCVVVYYSMSGNTEFAAHEIARETGADLIPIAPVKKYPDKGAKKFLWGGKSAIMGSEPELLPYEFDAEKYDIVIIGAPVWAGTVAPPIRTFIKENREALREKRIAAYVCMAGSGAQKALGKLKAALGIDSFAAETAFIDPKDKPSVDKIQQLQAFAEKLK